MSIETSLRHSNEDDRTTVPEPLTMGTVKVSVPGLWGIATMLGKIALGIDASNLSIIFVAGARSVFINWAL
jgi:hypothetical protein